MLSFARNRLFFQKKYRAVPLRLSGGEHRSRQPSRRVVSHASGSPQNKRKIVFVRQNPKRLKEARGRSMSNGTAGNRCSFFPWPQISS
jgi:hypothetical protein